MRDVVIKTGIYGRRDEKGRVLPVGKGERVTLADEEAARLVTLDVAAYVGVPVQSSEAPPAPPSGGQEPPSHPMGTPSGELPENPPVSGEEGDSTDAEVARLERMLKDDLEQMAQDLGVDISGARNKHDIAVLIAAAEADETYDPSEPEDEDIVR